MPAPPVRFEEIAYNYGFVPVEPSTNRGYCVVYRLFKECIEQPGRVVLIRGNERVIQLKDISGPLEDREKFTIYSQDIVDYYPFNFRSKAVGFLIDAKRRSKTGYWFLAFQREGQLAAFCSFLYWIINGVLPQHGRSLSPHQGSRSPGWYSTPPIRRRSPPRNRSRYRLQVYPVHSERYRSRYPSRKSIEVSCNTPTFTIEHTRSRSSSRFSSYSYYEPLTHSSYRRRSPSAGRSRSYNY